MRKMFVVAGLAMMVAQAGVSVAHADWAIAVGQSTKSSAYVWGDAWNYTDAADARKKALANCRSNGPNCKIVGEGAGQCVALAFGVDDNAWGWAQEPNKRAAAKSALRQCAGQSAGECEVKEAFCEE